MKNLINIYNNPVTGEDFEVVSQLSDGSTWYQGLIDASYSELVSAFGVPTLYDGSGKVQCEWNLVINGVICTIYDWKEYGNPPHTVRKWHIGGTVNKSVDLVTRAFEAWRNK